MEELREQPKGPTMGMLRHEGRVPTDIVEFSVETEWNAAKR